MMFGLVFQELDQLNLAGAQEFELLDKLFDSLPVFKMGLDMQLEYIDGFCACGLI